MWELLTLEVPFRDFEHAVVIFGVGQSKLQLPLPESFPKGYRLLMQMCWKLKPCNRPTFEQIISHINIASREFNDIPVEEFRRRQHQWKEEVRNGFSKVRSTLDSSLSAGSQLDLSQMGSQQSIANQSVKVSVSMIDSGSLNQQIEENELNEQHAKKQARRLQKDKDEQYEKMLKQTTRLYTEMVGVLTKLEKREKVLVKCEKVIYNKKMPKKDVSSLLRKALNDPVYQSSLELSMSFSCDDADPMKTVSCFEFESSFLILFSCPDFFESGQSERTKSDQAPQAFNKFW